MFIKVTCLGALLVSAVSGFLLSMIVISIWTIVERFRVKKDSIFPETLEKGDLFLFRQDGVMYAARVIINHKDISVIYADVVRKKLHLRHPTVRVEYKEVVEKK